VRTTTAEGSSNFVPPAPARGFRGSWCTTMLPANTPMVRRKDCLTPKSAR
jgi:hypothetical protein